MRIILPGLIFIIAQTISAQTISSAKTMESMVLANKYFMEKWPDVGKTIITERERPSNIWTRGVYYEGLMALYKLILIRHILNMQLTGVSSISGAFAMVLKPGMAITSAAARPI